MSLLNSVLGPIARVGLTWLSRRRLPQVEGELVLPGLSTPVEVLRDHWGVPHIYANTAEGLLYVQGFVHAQDRLWQMELNRRTAQGRLSQLFGELALDTDRTSRTFGFNRLGKIDWNDAPDDLRQAILSYTAGVNAFLESPDSKLPVEFTLLGHRPEPWQPEDTTAFARLMLWKLSHAWYGEIVRAQAIEAVGAEHATELDVRYPPRCPATLPEGIEFNRLDPSGLLGKVAGPFLDRGKGSNAWSISGSKSTTGHPFLCNDMHLGLSLPGIWYTAHLICDELQVTGVSLPGAPLVLVGHNASIAWGMTLAMTDCEDLFVEKLDPQNPHRYLFRDEWHEAEVIPEPIQVKGRSEAHVEQVIVTRHGPIISPVVEHVEQHLAVQSMALQPSHALMGWLLLNKAGGWDEFVDAMRLIDATQLNVAYADVDGNTGYWVTGTVPVRAKGDGTVPAPGWTGEYEWSGTVPFEEMPHALNPRRGFVLSCNHCIVPDDYPHFLGNVWMNGYRACRIEEVLARGEPLSAEDMGAIHVDLTCIPGPELVGLLEGLESTDPDVQLALDRLRAWDGNLTTDSVGGALYEVARYTLVRLLLEPALGPELLARLQGKGLNPVLLDASELYGHDTVALLRMLQDPDSWWVKQAGGRGSVLTRGLKQAVSWLRAELGDDVDAWQWGKIHRAAFPHALGLQKPLDQVFSRGPYPIGGDTDTPCQTAIQPDDPYDVKAWAPSFRQIVDLGDLGCSLTVTPPGQSGHLGSPHYDDLIEPWLNGEYHPMPWTREQVSRETENKLLLRGKE